MNAVSDAPRSPQYLSTDELRQMNFARLGQNVLIHRHCNIVNPDRISCGDSVRIDGFTNVIASRSIRFGSYIHIGSFCNLAGGEEIEINDFSTLSQGVKLFTTSDDYSGAAMTNPTVPEAYTAVHREPVRIGRHVVVGSSSVVLPGSDIGDGVAVGALSLVKGKLEPWGVYGGIPARRIKERKRDLLQLEAEFLSARSTG